MRTSSFVLTTALAASAAAALWFGTQWMHERSRNDALASEIDSLRGSRAPAHVETTQPRAPAQPREAARPGARMAEPVVEGVDNLPPESYGLGYNKVRQRLFASPEFHKAVRGQQRALLETQYRDLPRVLKLSPEQADRLFELLAEQSMDAYGYSKRSLLGPQYAATPEAEQQHRADDARLAEVIGASKLSALQEYRESLMSRDEVRMLATELAGASEPLREDQMEPMVAVVFTEQKRLEQESNELRNANPGMNEMALSAKGSQLAIAANARILEAARPWLSSAQLATLADLYRRQKLQMESQIEMNRIMSEAVASEARPPPR